MLDVKIISSGSLHTNCYLLTDGESGETAGVDCALYDAEYRRFLKTNGVEKLKYILLTHGHLDHIGGVKRLRESCGGEVCMHPGDGLELKSLNAALDELAGDYPRDFFVPDTLLDENSVLSLGEHEIRVMHTPGHTPGSLIYLCENLMFSGDTLFYSSIGRADLPGGSAKALLNSLRRIGLIEGEYTVYPGHGEKTTLSFEKKYNRFLRANDYLHT